MLQFGLAAPRSQMQSLPRARLCAAPMCAGPLPCACCVVCAGTWLERSATIPVTAKNIRQGPDLADFFCRHAKQVRNARCRRRTLPPPANSFVIGTAVINTHTLGTCCPVGAHSSDKERLGPSYFFISLLLGPLNSLFWYVPSSRYIWSSAPILFLHIHIHIHIPYSVCVCVCVCVCVTVCAVCIYA